MAITLLIIFIFGLGLLPYVYLERSRRRWQWSIRENGLAAQGSVVSIIEVRDRRGIPTGWFELTFEFQTNDSMIRTAVWVRSSTLRRGSLGVGDSLNIHYMPHVPTEAVPDSLDCRPPWASVKAN